jgi:DNA-binding GntR family transcriptional regulator
VDLRPHTGARVSPLSVAELEDLLVTRIGIEPWLARKGAPTLGDPQLAVMDERLAGLEAAGRSNDRVTYLQAIWDFRAVAYAAAGRPLLLEKASVLFTRSTRYHFLTIADAARFERSLQYMVDFGTACRRRDGDEAERVMREALEWTLVYLTAQMNETLENEALAALARGAPV